jgi:hypothetical protein
MNIFLFFVDYSLEEGIEIARQKAMAPLIHPAKKVI